LIFTSIKKGVRGAVWFGFEGKSHLNRKIKKHAVWFGLVWLTFKMKSESNQSKPMWFGLDRLVQFFLDNTIFCFQHYNRVKKL